LECYPSNLFLRGKSKALICGKAIASVCLIDSCVRENE
jgi:hypothetical protein